MGKLVVSEFVTLDGVMEDPGGAEGFDRGGWAFQFDQGAEGEKFKLDEVLAADALLLGRKTYEGFAKAWPSMTDDAGFADKMNSMPKYVVSRTLMEAAWNNSHIVRGDIDLEVRKLKDELSGDILVAGSGDLLHTLAHHDLVDEYRLMVFPIVLGAGHRLFRGGASALALKVTEVKPAGDVVILTLRRAA